VLCPEGPVFPSLGPADCITATAASVTPFRRRAAFPPSSHFGASLSVCSFVRLLASPDDTASCRQRLIIRTLHIVRRVSRFLSAARPVRPSVQSPLQSDLSGPLSSHSHGRPCPIQSHLQPALSGPGFSHSCSPPCPAHCPVSPQARPVRPMIQSLLQLSLSGPGPSHSCCPPCPAHYPVSPQARPVRPRAQSLLQPALSGPLSSHSHGRPCPMQSPLQPNLSGPRSSHPYGWPCPVQPPLQLAQCAVGTNLFNVFDTMFPLSY
jgi:hypothetical protein